MGISYNQMEETKMKTVFTPNATSKLVVEDTIKLIKKKVDVLDLGCGEGYIGLNIYKKKKDILNHLIFQIFQKKPPIDVKKT